MSEEIPDEEYLEDREPRQRVLDERMIHEPISVLQPAAPVCVESGTPVADTIRRMQENRIGCVLVTQESRLVGIFTERDVLRQVVGGEIDIASTTVDTLMTRNPETLSPDSAIVFALNKMSLGGFRHVPLVDGNGCPVGIISVKDIVDYIVDFFPEVLNVPPEPGLDVTRAREGA